jgi:hypothetical protein
MKKRTKKLTLSRESVARLDQVRGGDVDPDPPSVRSGCEPTTTVIMSCQSGC